MNIHEFIERYKKAAAESNLPIEISDEEYAKMFLSHIVVAEWQLGQMVEAEKKEKRRRSYRRNPLSGAGE